MKSKQKFEEIIDSCQYCIIREMNILKQNIPDVIRKGYITMDTLVKILDSFYSLFLLIMPNEILNKLTPLYETKKGNIAHKIKKEDK